MKRDCNKKFRKKIFKPYSIDVCFYQNIAVNGLGVFCVNHPGFATPPMEGNIQV